MTGERGDRRLGVWPGAQRLLLVFAGLVAGALLLEAGMRAAGGLIRRGQRTRNAEVLLQKHDLRILCVGESTTEGSGESGRYPEMLQEILNRERLGLRFAVVNKGMSGATSVQLLAMLEDQVDTIAADLLVVMMGINDPGKTRAWGSIIGPGSDRWYGEWRLYKLYRLIATGSGRQPPPLAGGAGVATLDARVELETGAVGGVVADPVKGARRATQRADPARSRPTPLPESINARLDAVRAMIASDQVDSARRELSAMESQFPTLDAPATLRATIYRRMGMPDEAHRILVAAAEALPGASAGFFADLALSYANRGDYAKAIDLLRYAIAELVDPNLRHDVTHYMLLLAQFYERAGDMPRAEATYRTIVIDVNPGDDLTYEHLVSFFERYGRAEEAARHRGVQARIRHQQVSPITRTKYAELRKLARARSLRLLAVQYPMRSVEVLRRLLSDEPGVAFLDNSRFAELVRRDGYATYFTDRFAGDFGHMTRWGHCVLATRVAGAILEEVLDLVAAPDGALGRALALDGCALAEESRR